MMCFKGGLAAESLKIELSGRPWINWADLFERAQKIDSVEAPEKEEKRRRDKERERLKRANTRKVSVECMFGLFYPITWE